jgi:hypothetical protein
MLSRRTLLSGLGASLAAPAIVPIHHLMALPPLLWRPRADLFDILGNPIATVPVSELTLDHFCFNWVADQSCELASFIILREQRNTFRSCRMNITKPSLHLLRNDTLQLYMVQE